MVGKLMCKPNENFPIWSSPLTEWYLFLKFSANARLAAAEKARIPMVDPFALKQLLDMGFPEIAARKALASNE